MNYVSILKISVMCQLKTAFVAPVFFGWCFFVSTFLNAQINTTARFFLSCILLTYQQFQYIQEDKLDGFFDYIIFNNTKLLPYVLAKTTAIFFTGIIPLCIINLCIHNSSNTEIIYAIQMVIFIYFITFFACIDKKIINTQLLLTGLPLFTAPIIFMFNIFELSGLFFFAGSITVLFSIISLLLIYFDNL